MVPSRKQGSARGRTKRRHMKSIVTKSLRRELVERRRGDGAAERGWITKAGIVNQYEMGPVNNVLNAAALTYVAATLQSVLQLLYFIFRFTGNRER